LNIEYVIGLMKSLNAARSLYVLAQARWTQLTGLGRRYVWQKKFLYHFPRIGCSGSANIAVYNAGLAR
jgi:hypothetical protein